MLATTDKTAGSSRGQYDLKYFSIRFSYRGASRSLRLIGWNEESVLKEFCERFPEATPEHVECLGNL
jgi:hypothetical protein